jgi:hypothetical protein
MEVNTRHSSDIPSIGEIVESPRLSNSSLTRLGSLAKGHLLSIFPDAAIILTRFSSVGRALTRQEPRPRRASGAVTFHVGIFKKSKQAKIWAANLEAKKPGQQAKEIKQRWRLRNKRCIQAWP